MLRQYKTKFKVKTKVVIFRENENGSFSELTAKSGFNCPNSKYLQFDSGLKLWLSGKYFESNIYLERFSIVKLGRSAFLLRSANELNFFPSYNLKALVYTFCAALASYGLWTGCQRRQNFIYYTPVWSTVLSL